MSIIAMTIVNEHLDLMTKYIDAYLNGKQKSEEQIKTIHYIDLNFKIFWYMYEKFLEIDDPPMSVTIFKLKMKCENVLNHLKNKNNTEQYSKDVVAPEDAHLLKSSIEQLSSILNDVERSAKRNVPQI